MSVTALSQCSIHNSKLPLYLAHQTHVSLDVGPSLVVKSMQLVSCRYPLLRISRLMIASGVRIHSDAIAACLHAGIPLTWQKRDGSALGVAFPLDGHDLSMNERIDIMMAHKHWRECYDAWVSAQQRIALRALSRRFNISFDHFNRDECVRCILHRHGMRVSQELRLMQSWHAMVCSVIVKYWRTLDIQAEHLSSPADDWNVLKDMADCLVLDMLIALIREKNRWNKLMAATGSDIDFALIQAFEQRSPRVLRLIGAMHQRFLRWLLDMEAWR